MANIVKVNSLSLLSFDYLTDQRVRFKLSGPGMKKKPTHTFLLKEKNIKCCAFIFTERAAREAPAAWGVGQTVV